MTSNNKYWPEWRKAWKVDDTEWMKARRKAWREIKPSVELASWFLSKDEKKQLKFFFMTGSGFDREIPEKDWEYYCFHPDSYPIVTQGSIIFECWLHVDQSEASWDRIRSIHGKDEYISSRNRFRELFRYRYPEKGTLFGDVEERLYHFFSPTRCRPQDYSNDNYPYPRTAYSVFGTLLSIISLNCLNPQQKINNDHGLVMFAQEWCDSFEGLYEGWQIDSQDEEDPKEWVDNRIEYIDQLMLLINKIIVNPEKYEPLQIGVAQKINKFLKDVPVPEPLKSIIEKRLTS